MANGKDPAFMFFTADFLADTTLWSYEELGRYIKLLCLQHLQEGITEDDFLSVADGYKRITAKFDKGADGLYRNHRMTEEVEKRKAYSAAQSKRRLDYLASTKLQPTPNQASTKLQPSFNPRVENEIDNDNDIVIDNSLGIEEIRESEREEEKRIIHEIILYLNSKLGTRYQATAEYINKHIRARLAEGFTYEDFCAVIDKKYNEWSGTEMAKFLRPETLFGTKFMTYLNQPDVPVKPKTAIGANGVEYYVGASDLDDVIPG